MQNCHACGYSIQPSPSEAHTAHASQHLLAQPPMRHVHDIREDWYDVDHVYVRCVTLCGWFFLVVTVILVSIAYFLVGTLPTSCGFGGIINIFDVYVFIPRAIIVSASALFLSFYLRHMLTKKVDDRHHIAFM